MPAENAANADGQAVEIIELESDELGNFDSLAMCDEVTPD
jgi:hypothetical protein